MGPRSYLYAPANRPELCRKAMASGADAVILDLEDAVPEHEKPRARMLAAALLAEHCRAPHGIFVRLNSGEAALDDLAALPLDNLTGVVIAKAEEPDLIAQICKRLTAGEVVVERRSPQPRRMPIVIQPLVESVRGMYGLDALALASPRVRRVGFGAGDYVLDIHAERTAERTETLYARMHLVARSRFLGLEQPVGHVFTPLADLEGLRFACDADRRLGFFGRSCIHPSQLAVIHDAFTTAGSELQHARLLIDAYEAAVRRGHGAFMMPDGTFVDEAVFKRAKALLRLEVADTQRVQADNPHEAMP